MKIVFMSLSSFFINILEEEGLFLLILKFKFPFIFTLPCTSILFKIDNEKRKCVKNVQIIGLIFSNCYLYIITLLDLRFHGKLCLIRGIF